jgi:hypothetical protein
MAWRLPPLARKLLWFAAIYAASVVVVAAVAYGLRALLIP